jgi:hypothetical protein
VSFEVAQRLIPPREYMLLTATASKRHMKSHTFNPGDMQSPISSGFVKTMVFVDVDQENIANTVYCCAL